MWKDPIIEEIHQIREAHAKQFNYDMWAIYQDLKAKEMKSPWKKISRNPSSLEKINEISSNQPSVLP
jgi:hypothetical protein